jgi:hypothetical protein
MAAMERLEALDEKPGVGCGAAKEREKLSTTIQLWEEQQQQQLLLQQQPVQQRPSEAQLDNDFGIINEDGDDTTATSSSPDADRSSKFVFKHSPADRIAVFGGDPKKRRLLVENTGSIWLASRRRFIRYNIHTAQD